MKKILIDFSKVLAPTGISRFVAKNLVPFLTLHEEDIRKIYKNHITWLVLWEFSIKSLIEEYHPYFHKTTTIDQLYQQFFKIPPIHSAFLSFLQEQKWNDKTYYLVSDLYPELWEQIRNTLWTTFDKYLFSYEVGKKKSDPLFWESVIEDDMTLFIDDRRDNIEQVGKYGIEGYLFTSFDNLVHNRETIWK